jgi:cytochrome P450
VSAPPPAAQPSGLTQLVLGDGTPTVLVTRHDDVCQFFLDRRLSRASASAAAAAAGPLLAMSVTELDPPLHTRLRAVLNAGWSARRVNRLRRSLELTAKELLDAMVAAGPPLDLVAAMCVPFSFSAHFEVLGVPARFRDSIQSFLQARAAHLLGGVSRERIHSTEVGLYEEVARVVDAVRATPGRGLLDDLVAAADRDGLLDESELRGVAASMLLDGHFLASAQIANAVACLLSDPRHIPVLRNDADLMDSAVEEFLRLEPSVNYSLARVATTDVRLRSGTIHAGQTVTALPLHANRDPAMFAEADDVVLRRGPNPHLSFGRGIHFCLGAHLVRLEIRVCLEELLRRLPELRLAVPASELQRFAIQGARGVLTLPVAW